MHIPLRPLLQPSRSIFRFKWVKKKRKIEVISIFFSTTPPSKIVLGNQYTHTHTILWQKQGCPLLTCSRAVLANDRSPREHAARASWYHKVRSFLSNWAAYKANKTRITEKKVKQVVLEGEGGKYQVPYLCVGRNSRCSVSLFLCNRRQVLEYQEFESVQCWRLAFPWGKLDKKQDIKITRKGTE